jgi:hypothetical protein
MGNVMSHVQMQGHPLYNNVYVSPFWACFIFIEISKKNIAL